MFNSCPQPVFVWNQVYEIMGNVCFYYMSQKGIIRGIIMGGQRGVWAPPLKGHKIRGLHVFCIINLCKWHQFQRVRVPFLLIVLSPSQYSSAGQGFWHPDPIMPGNISYEVKRRYDTENYRGRSVIPGQNNF